MTTTDMRDARSEDAIGTDEELLRQIASALACLSRQKTVPNPVYRKTGVASRAALVGLMTGRTTGAGWSFSG